jgi:hypothetical protein
VLQPALLAGLRMLVPSNRVGPVAGGGPFSGAIPSGKRVGPVQMIPPNGSIWHGGDAQMNGETQSRKRNRCMMLV